MSDSIALNLDTVERERKYEEFAVVVGERRCVLADPADLTWQELAELRHPVQFLRLCMSKEDREHFTRQKIEGWKFNELMRQYQEHYGIDNLGNAGA